ncbi:biotin attachment protein [Azoarcus sp. DD4]|uniref:lipoyl domain-containing protein n=1 Tax=Azoarcus sp. DD4 TaxID=2027405 RepID=UPI0011294845|nr:lipoyl domain-containing protein [Azoarcus sp. DD4]QDF99441.1 biotin attachment protein [Azoarcus sp. DD4]
MTEIILDDAVWADVDEGTEALLQEWQVKEGDSVAAGQVLAVAELVKTSHEIFAPSAGRIAKLNVAEQDTFGRGAVIALLEA